MATHGCIGVPCRICFPHLQPFTKDDVAKAEQAVLAEVDSLKAQLAAATAQRDELAKAWLEWDRLQCAQDAATERSEQSRLDIAADRVALAAIEKSRSIARAQSGQPASWGGQP